MQRNSTAGIIDQLNPFKKLAFALALTACLPRARAGLCISSSMYSDCDADQVVILGGVGFIMLLVWCINACSDGHRINQRAARERAEADGSYQRLEEGRRTVTQVPAPTVPPVAVELVQPTEGAADRLSPSRLVG